MRLSVSVLASAILLGACAGRVEESPGAAGAPADAPSSALPEIMSAVLRDSLGRELGTLTLTNAPTGIKIAGTLRGLPPGVHGFHVHTTGACSPLFEAAGGHWNPTARQHGRDNPMGPHHGDIASIIVGADSSATVDATTLGGSLRGTDPLLDADGAAIVVHAGPDDHRTDPAGDSGSRLACGVVTRR